MAEISAKLVKELRDKTGAGMLDCKKALAESDGDIEKAVEWLRKRGITKAEKALSKTTAEGLVGSYIHTGGRVGVLVEVNCQTDFVARNETFQQLVRDVAMQIAASPNVEYVKVADIPEDVIAKEKEIEAGKDDLSNKPEAVRAKIVEGRIEKRLKEMSLLDQSYIKDQSITVEEHIKNVIASLGENIQVRRFVRFVMGEGIEKEETDFAAEVAAQTGAKAEPKPGAETQEEPKPEATAELAPETQEEPKPEATAELAPETQEEPKPEAKVEAKAGPKEAKKKDDKKKKK